MWQQSQTTLSFSDLNGLPVILPIDPFTLAPTNPDIWAPRLTPIMWMELRERPFSWKKKQQNNNVWHCDTQHKVVLSSLHMHLQPFNKCSEVFSHHLCVFCCFQIIHIGSSVVPVHYYEIHVCPGQQQLCNAWQPRGWRSRGPVAVNEEGSRSGDVKLGVRSWVGVGHECPTDALWDYAIFSGVQQQPHSDAGSDEGVTEIQVYEFITYLIWKQQRF